MRQLFQRLGNRIRGGVNRLRQRFGRGGGAAAPGAAAPVARTEGALAGYEQKAAKWRQQGAARRARIRAR